MIIPLYSYEPSRAWAVCALLLICIAAFFIAQLRPGLYFGWGVVPAEITSGEDLVNSLSPPDHSEAEPYADQPLSERLSSERLPQRPAPGSVYLTLVTATLLHGSLPHLAFNLIILWVFGRVVEAAFVRRLVGAFSFRDPRLTHLLGSSAFVAFFFAAGALSTLPLVYSTPGAFAPILGASGAIATLLGLCGTALPRIRIVSVVGTHIVSVPAWILVLFYGLFQVIFALFSGESLALGAGPSVAYEIHIAGLLIGAVCGLFIPIRTSPDDSGFDRWQSGFNPRTSVWSMAPFREVSLLGQLGIAVAALALSAASLYVATKGAVQAGVPYVVILPVWLYLTPTVLYPAQISTLRLVLLERSLLLPRTALLPTLSPATAGLTMLPCLFWAALVYVGEPFAAAPAPFWHLAPVFFIVFGFAAGYLADALAIARPATANPY